MAEHGWRYRIPVKGWYISARQYSITVQYLPYEHQCGFFLYVIIFMPLYLLTFTVCACLLVCAHVYVTVKLMYISVVNNLEACFLLHAGAEHFCSWAEEVSLTET
jgi:hypothetical protein